MKEKAKTKLKVKLIKFIELRDWDRLVKDTYKRPYSFQQQEGCKPRGVFKFAVPNKYTDDSSMHDSIPEVINGNEIGVKFQTWLQRSPKKPIPSQSGAWYIDLFWERSFYPDVYTVANDLHKKGLLEAGEYAINIDW